jgi:hypothetical protein
MGEIWKCNQNRTSEGGHSIFKVRTEEISMGNDRDAYGEVPRDISLQSRYYNEEIESQSKNLIAREFGKGF